MQLAKYQGITDAHCRDIWGEYCLVSRWNGGRGDESSGCGGGLM